MKQKNKIATIVKNRYERIKEINEDVFDNIEVNKNLYHNQINTDDDYEWDYSLFDPFTFPVVRNYLSRTNPAKIRIQLNSTKEHGKEYREINQDILNWELNELLLTNLFLRIFYSGYIAGKGYLKTGWKYRKRNIVESDGREFEINDIVNYAEAKFVRFNDLLIPNRNIPELEEQPYIIELIQMRVGDMIDENEMFGEEKWDAKWLEKLRASGNLNKGLDYHVDLPTDTETQEDIVFKSSFVNLICMQTKENDLIYVPLEEGDKVVNKDQENPFWHGHYPYIDFTPFPEDDEFYTMSVVDSFADLQIAANENLNQTLTNVRQVNNSMWISGSPAAQTPDWMFVNRPNGIIRTVGDVSQIQQVRQQDNTRASLAMSESLQNKIERSSGISSLYASGAGGSNINQTARGAMVIEENIDTNVRLIMDLFSSQVIKRLGEHFLELNSQYITEEQTFDITNKRGVSEIINVSPEQVSANYKVTVTSDYMLKQTPASKQASLQNMINVLTNIKNTSGIDIDVVPIVDALISEYPELSSIGVENIIMSNDEKAKSDITMISRGQMPEVKQRDNHSALIEIAQVHLSENYESYPEPILKLFTEYMDKHMKYITAARETAMMSQPAVPEGMNQEQLLQNIQGGMGQEQAGLNPQQNVRTYDLKNLLTGENFNGV